MNTKHYSEFQECKNRGDRNGARQAIQAFCNSFESLQERVSWTKPFLESGDYGHRIRHELYAYVILPALLDGYRKKDLWSTLWLARTCQSLYQMKEIHAELGHPTDSSLLRECYEIDPSQEDVRVALLETDVRWFRYCIHEWPAGVLYGNDGATPEQCEEILKAIAFARTLDHAGQFAGLLDDVERKTTEYIKRMPTTASTATDHSCERE
jgi:hypothetical protein